MPDSQDNGQQDTPQNLSAEDHNKQLFLSLVTSMQMGAMYQLGKVASPISGKVERDLRQAQYTIDLLAMLQARTEGNLASEESENLRRIVSELRLNFIDESAKPDPEEVSAESGAESADNKESKEARNTNDTTDKTETAE